MFSANWKWTLTCSFYWNYRSNKQKNTWHTSILHRHYIVHKLTTQNSTWHRSILHRHYITTSYTSILHRTAHDTQAYYTDTISYTSILHRTEHDTEASYTKKHPGLQCWSWQRGWYKDWPQEGIERPSDSLSFASMQESETVVHQTLCMWT